MRFRERERAQRGMRVLLSFYAQNIATCYNDENMVRLFIPESYCSKKQNVLFVSLKGTLEKR